MTRNLRKCLRIIRDPHTLPSTILPNGEDAETMAHIYVLQGNKKRNMKKRKRDDAELRDVEISAGSDSPETG